MPFGGKKFFPKTKETISAKLSGYQVNIQFKSIRHTYLRLKPNGEININAPLCLMAANENRLTPKGEKTLSEFIIKYKKWIEVKQRSHTFARQHYYDGAIIHHFGKEFRLSIQTAQDPRLDNINHKLILKSSDNFPETVKKKLEDWQRKMLLEKLQILAAKWEGVMGLKAKEYRIRKMSTRWGTCNPNARRIWISLSLIEKPEVCLEYIIVHELVHLIERSHNSRFKALMDKFLPCWREYRLMLKT